MGDRAQVLIKDTGVFLYTHWNGTELIETVKRALTKRQRWDDPEYLARIIFDEMVGKGQGEETGFGIGTEQHGDVWRIITVDCERSMINVKDNGRDVLDNFFGDFIRQG